MSEKEKCANCGEEHERSYHQCAFYRNKLEEKINKINSNNGPTRSISQRVNSSQTDMEKQIIESMKTMIENTQNLLINEIKKSSAETNTKIVNVQNDLNTYKAKQLYIEIDDYEIINNKKLTNEQVKKLINARKNHGINVNGKLVLEYLNNKPVNFAEYKKLQYV